MNNSLKLLLLTVLNLYVLAVFLSGCGNTNDNDSDNGNSSPASQALTGVFLDSAVEGLSYDSGYFSGVTDSSGTFKFKSGDVVRFFIGDIEIGSALAAETLTPVDLVSGASDETHPTVLNITAFLMSLDNDANPDNGITVSKKIKNNADSASVDFTVTNEAFVSDTNNISLITNLTTNNSMPQTSLVQISNASEHLKGTILKSFAGSWNVGYTGHDSGSCTLAVTSTGNACQGAAILPCWVLRMHQGLSIQKALLSSPQNPWV